MPRVFPEFHAAVGIEAVEPGEAKVSIVNVDDFHRIIFRGILWI